MMKNLKRCFIEFPIKLGENVDKKGRKKEQRNMRLKNAPAAQIESQR